MSERSITLNLIPDYAVSPVLRVSQFDKGYNIEATIYKGSEKYVIPTECKVKIEGRKPDGIVYQYAATFTDSVVTFPINEQMTVVKGSSMAELVIYYGSVRIGFANFEINVEPAALNEDAAISETDLPILQELIEAAGKAEGAAEKADSAVTKAEEAANKAEEAANKADAAITTVETKKTEAVKAINTARDSAKNAVNAKKTEAVNAVESAKTSAITSIEKASEDSEAWAVGKRGGVDVSSTDETYHNNAKWYADHAGVTSVNGKTGDVTLTASDVKALPSSTSYVSSFNGKKGAITGVTSVNGKTGDVTLTASDVKALPSSTSYVSSFNGKKGAITGVTSVNGKTGDVTIESGGKCLIINISEFDSLPQTVENEKITDTMVVVNSVLSNPAAQTSDWAVDTNTAGQVTVGQGGTIDGSTSLTLYLMES